METAQYITGILMAVALSAGWIAVQILARKTGTKNHFDQPTASCSDFGRSCNCGGDTCINEQSIRKA